MVTPQLNFFLNFEKYIEYKTFLYHIANLINKRDTIYKSFHVPLSNLPTLVEVTCIDGTDPYSESGSVFGILIRIRNPDPSSEIELKKFTF